MEVWNIEKDHENRPLDIPKLKTKSNRSWAPLFSSGEFLAEDPVLELEHHALKDRKLRMLGERMTTWRAKILSAARDQAILDNKNLGSAAKEIKIHGKKVRARG